MGGGLLSSPGRNGKKRAPEFAWYIAGMAESSKELMGIDLEFRRQVLPCGMETPSV